MRRRESPLHHYWQRSGNLDHTRRWRFSLCARPCAMPLHVCDQCSAIKQRCDGKSPCSRCARLELDCARLRTHGRQNRSANNEQGNGELPEPRKKYRAVTVRRDRTGCDTCKKRKKKCDEAKPKCSDCRRLNLPCVRTIHGAASPPSPAVAQSASSDDAPSSKIDPELLQSAVSHPDQTSPSGGIYPVDETAVAYRTRPVYQWLARRPSATSSSSVTDGVEHTDDAKHEGGKAGSPGTEVGIVKIPSGSPARKLSWLPLDPMSIPYALILNPLDQLTNRQDQHLFHHYTHVVSRSLSIASADGDNPFLKMLMPLASASNAVMGALLALSATHLKYNGGYPEIAQRGLNRQTAALISLNKLITSGLSTSFFREQALAAILLFCIIDIREGNSSKWSWHIDAAKTVITADMQASELSLHTSSWPFLLDVFEYVDYIITISKCKPPLINHEDLRPEEGTRSLDTPSAPPHSTKGLHYNAIFGVARPLFRIIGQISELSSRRPERVDPEFDQWFRQTASVIESKLRNWTAPYPEDDSTSAPSPSSSTIPAPTNSETVFERDLREAAHAALAIKWASLLRLHQIVEGYDLPHPVPSECLQHILNNLNHIRVGSPVESLMVFPLTMAGSVALSKDDRMTIRSRWLIIERTIGFGNLAKGGRMQEKVWNDMDEELSREAGFPTKVTVNWARTRWEQYHELVLF
ncbi:fungal-specific transcription factor domain-containing protein [Xylogone sp. PMI_703]|nr:fungal-specific transcription factor domain-containing protein [Xylogone sp. PMI_703]